MQLSIALYRTHGGSSSLNNLVSTHFSAFASIFYIVLFIYTCEEKRGVVLRYTFGTGKLP